LTEINLKPFKFKDFNSLIDLLKSQNYPDLHNITYRTLPKIGYIAYLGSEPIAAGFLRRLEPCYAHLDTLASSGYFGSQVRHEGVSKVVDALIMEAKRLKLEGIVATTKDAGILKRAQSLGFKVVPQTIIALEVK